MKHDYVACSRQDLDLLLHEDIEKYQSLRRSHGTTRCGRWIDSVTSGSLVVLRYIIVSALLMSVVIILTPGLLVQMIRKMSLDSTVVPMKIFPLGSEIKWKVIPGDVDYWSDEIYMGEPSKESEQAWNKLIHSGQGAFRVIDEEAVELNLTIGLALEKGGYGTILGVDHNLHCLRHIRQMIYYDHYWGNLTNPVALDWLGQHTVHCLETIRRSLMCSPDLNMYPRYVGGNPFHPIRAGSWNTKECVDWDLLQQTVKPRVWRGAELSADVRETIMNASRTKMELLHSPNKGNHPVAPER